MMEDTRKRTLLIFSGDVTVFFPRPIFASFLAFIALLVAFHLIPPTRRSKSKPLKE